jgi:hypothetical protein
MVRLLVVLLAGLELAAGAVPAGNSRPFWAILTYLTPEERGNARIDIELDGSPSEPVRSLARAIEQLWNDGQPASALARFAELDTLLAPASAAVGISWRRPAPSASVDFDPVRISTRDSFYVAGFEIDYNFTHHYFSALALQGDGTGSRLSVNISTDLGNTWSETFILSGYTYPLNDVCGRVMLHDFWLVYTGGGTNSRNHALWARKFNAEDGSSDTFANGSNSRNFYNAPAQDTVMEVEVVSNQIYAQGVVYTLALMASDSLRYFTMGVTRDTAWNRTDLSLANAREGLDACDNDGRLSNDTSLLFVSYVGAADSVHILRELLGGAWETYRSTWCGPAGTFRRSTSISCRRDTLMCAYTYNGRRVRYQLRRGRQATWVYGEPPQDTTRGNGFADITSRNGYTHLVFWQDPDIGFHTKRPYSSTTWPTPLRYDGGQGVGSFQPEVRWTARGDTVGIAWVTPDITTQRACFTGDPATGVWENPGSAAVSVPLFAFPTRGGIAVRYAHRRSGSFAVSVIDALGREVGRYRPSQPAGTHQWFWPAKTQGVYFVRLTTQDCAATSKVFVTR